MKFWDRSRIFETDAHKIQLIQSLLEENKKDWDHIEEPLGNQFNNLC